MSELPPPLYCATHPKQETSLRCNRCEKLICSKCAILTPTGYRCRDCVRGGQKVFETAEWYDYPVSFSIAGVLSFLGSLIASNLGFFVIFIAPIAGTIIAEAARFVVRRRRSKRLYQLVTFGALVGSLPILLINLINVIIGFTQAGTGGITLLFGLLWPGLYAVTVTTTVYYRLGGLVFKR